MDKAFLRLLSIAFFIQIRLFIELSLHIEKL